MSIERDKHIYIGLWNAVNDGEGCLKEFRIIYQSMLKKFEVKYGEETLRRWIDDKGFIKCSI